MPWILLRRDDPIEHDLDYTDMLPPVAWYQSLKRRHFLVFIAVSTTALLKVQVVLAASLFQLAVVNSVHQVDVQTFDSFAVSDTSRNGSQAGSIANVQALDNFDMRLPFGVADDCAYQTFMTRQDETNEWSRPTMDTPVTAVVDGLFTNMSCVPVKDCSMSRPNVDGGRVNISLDFAECDKPFDMRIPITTLNPQFRPTNLFWGMTHESNNGIVEEWCKPASGEALPLLYYGVHFTGSPSNASEPAIDACAATLCSSKTWVTPVQVVDDGISENVTFVEAGQGGSEDKTVPFEGYDPWLAMNRAVLNGDYFTAGTQFRGPVKWLFDKTGKKAEDDDLSVYSSDLLRDAVEQEINAHNPMLAHYQLRQESQDTVSGSRTIPSNRLKIRPGIGIAVITLSAVAAIAALIMCWQAREMAELYSRDPATLLGSLTVAHDDDDYFEKVARPLMATIDARKEMWTDCTYSPMVLQPWYRSLLVLYALGLIVSLAVTLQNSNRDSGLANVDHENAWLPLLYQSLPALAMLGMSLYASSSDIAIRGLSSHISLTARQSPASVLDRSLLDMLGIRALVLSVLYKLPAVTLSQILAIACGFLPIMSSVLFQPELVPEAVVIQAEQQSWFGFAPWTVEGGNQEVVNANREGLAALGLMRNLSSSNFTYPRNTYNDLVFPSLKIDESSLQEGRKSVNLTIPAAKLYPSCVKLSKPNDYEITPRNWTEEQVFYDITFTQKRSCPDGTERNYTDYLSLGAATVRDGWALFGDIASSPDNAEEACGFAQPVESELQRAWRLQTYVWGNFTAEGMKFEHLSAWRCNYSWIEVPTHVNLVPVDGDLQIDHMNPPVQDSSNLQPWEPPFSIPAFERQLTKLVPNIDVGVAAAFGLINQYRSILAPFGQLSLESFNDADQDKAILDALSANLGFGLGQLANLESRLGLNETSGTEPRFHGDLPPIEATIIDHGRYRLIQDGTVTKVIIVILAVHAAANVWALISFLVRRLSPGAGRKPWLLDIDLQGLAPAGFSSFAMTEALLRSSNILYDLPENAHLLPAKNLRKYLDGKEFKLGWFFDTRTGKPELTVGALDDETFVFIGDTDKDGRSETSGSVNEVRYYASR